MNILQVHDIANVAAILADGLRLSGYEVTLKHFKLRGPKRYTPWRIFFLPERLREILWVSNFVRRGTYDIIHIHYAYLGLVGILARKPYFLHCHGTDVSISLSRPIIGAITRRAIKGARIVFFSTPDLFEYIQPIRPDAVFIPNPINTQAFKPDSCQRGGTALKILFISGLSARFKGGKIQAQIIKGLKRRLPDVDITVLLSTPSIVRDLSPLGITFTPRVPHEKMPALINEYDIIVGQTGVGALGMAELEAMACGKPVVAYFKYDSWYPEPPPIRSTNDPIIGVEYVIELIKDQKLRANLGKRAREWIVEYHDYLKIVQQMEDYYQAFGRGEKD